MKKLCLVLIGLFSFNAFAALPDDGLTIDTLWSAVQTSKARTVEQVLGLLPESYQHQYTLVYDSRSLQQASFESPRVISYGNDARLVFAWNGEPSQRGFDRIEAIQFDDKTKQFHFFELAFSKDGSRAPELTRPKHCAACHHGAPLWNTYFFWPGVYGSEDDQETFLPSAEVKNDIETKWFDKFVARREAQSASHEGRYQFLEAQGRSYSGDVRPNTQLSSLFHILNMQRIARVIASDESLRSLRYALLTPFFKDCADLQGFFPADLQPKITELLQLLTKHKHAVNNAALEEKYRRNRALLGREAISRAMGGHDTSDFYDRDFAAFQFLVEGFSNLDPLAWNLEFAPKAYDYDINGDISELKEPLMGELFPERYEFLRVQSLDYWSCNKLRELHLKSLAWDAPLGARVEHAIEKLTHRLP